MTERLSRRAIVARVATLPAIAALPVVASATSDADNELVELKAKIVDLMPQLDRAEELSKPTMKLFGARPTKAHPQELTNSGRKSLRGSRPNTHCRPQASRTCGMRSALLSGG
jgi:hypothetical protein